MGMNSFGLRAGQFPRKAMLCAGIAAAGMVSVPLTSGNALAGEPAAIVTMSNKLKFQPATVTVKAGETVRWHNKSVLVHTVTANPELAAKARDVALPDGAKPFNSGNLKPKATFEHKFTVPGTYKYFCIPHEAAGMVATVVVTK